MVKLIHTLADHSDDVNCCAFSSSLLATCSLDKTVRLYSLSDFTELPHSPLKFHTYAVHCCCFSPSGHLLASCSTDGTTVLWNTQNGHTLAVMEQPSGSPVRVCRFSPDSSCLASGAADGTVVLWNTQSYKLYRCGSVKDGSLVACAFSPSGNLFVTGSSCGDLTVWDDKMRCLHSEKAHDLGITCCDFSSQPISDGELGHQSFRLASCGQDCQIKIWIVSFSHILERSTEDQLKQFTEDWSEEDVSMWLCEQGLMDLVDIFKMNNIDGKELLNLTKESLADDLKIESLGLRSKVMRKIEELRTKMKSLSSGIPDEFICPITRELMKDPVIAADGYSYEKEAMESWIGKKKRTSPMTNLVLPSLVLTPNRTLKMAINRWLETQQK
ncbi:PREDICTED: WD repeat, SAM and U-box domain-containing protein 1 isoform X2 [Elephantulus edwardii]|uniref:WD repeat, SAM and U-box domain-containing protein 1 isoform X2 n=1 Tax=Elephantulus edwardii TaxID=28737 RepID=UPI0003F0926F|nr:PREDICTED: WD repeat, SAM and U-box domain-containing protein 1 isoform X2 [Elephantulus edwardii]